MTLWAGQGIEILDVEVVETVLDDDKQKSSSGSCNCGITILVIYSI
jgi:hypothetical protein